MQILLCGDAHCDIGYVEAMARHTQEFAASKMIILGDVGLYWPGYGTYQTEISDIAKRYGIDIYCIDGNHENHGVIGLWHDRDDFVEIEDRFFYIPRGFSWVWEDRKFIALGGAYSIDVASRVAGKSWWFDENFSPAQLQRAINHGKADIVLTHDVPMVANLPGWIHEKGIFEESRRTRMDLNKLWDSSQCKILFHGHHHVGYVDIIDGRKIQGLDCNMSMGNAWIILDLERK